MQNSVIIHGKRETPLRNQKEHRLLGTHIPPASGDSVTAEVGMDLDLHNSVL